jgi:CcmD family protein
MAILLQTDTAQTLNYMIAGFCVIFGFMGLYLISIWLRRRNLERELELLNTLQVQPE